MKSHYKRNHNLVSLPISWLVSLLLLCKNVDFAKFKYLAILYTFTFLTIIPTKQAHAFDPYFDTELSIELCPEYHYRDVDINVFYRVNGIGNLISADVISSTIDTNANLYKPVVRLPAFYTFIPFTIVSTCTSTSQGPSQESNSLRISNCDKLAQYDTDFDGISNDREDLNCDNFYSPGDSSNPDNADSDGDGVADLAEVFSGTDPSNPGSSPRPFINSAAIFDPDSDGLSNPVVWRPSNGTWYIKTPSSNIAFPFGQIGDVPFTYKDINQESNVGVIRRNQTQLIWYFRGSGFTNSAGINPNLITFGIFGDNIISGPWETPGVTNPAVARLVSSTWEFYVLLSNGTIRRTTWGTKGDLLKIQDFDGDGILDAAVFRPSTQVTYVKQSSNDQIKTYAFGSGTSDYTVKGDYTGDGKDELTFWEPITGTFSSLTSDNGLNPEQGALRNPNYYKELQLGEYYLDLPLSWNSNGTKNLYTVINHFLGIRKFHPNNDANQPIQSIQWGLYGDSQG